VRILIDMNLSPRWVPLLAAAGFDAVHWSTQGPQDASDTTLMTSAGAHGQVVLTHDLDFGAMLAAAPLAGPSVVQLRAGDVSPEAIGLAVIAALKQLSNELGAGALVTVDPQRTRIRLLPLKR
jgi:predicted nuclease of predicted toxin-antitoxin system